MTIADSEFETSHLLPGDEGANEQAVIAGGQVKTPRARGARYELRRIRPGRKEDSRELVKEEHKVKVGATNGM